MAFWTDSRIVTFAGQGRLKLRLTGSAPYGGLYLCGSGECLDVYYRVNADNNIYRFPASCPCFNNPVAIIFEKQLCTGELRCAPNNDNFAFTVGQPISSTPADWFINVAKGTYKVTIQCTRAFRAILDPSRPADGSVFDWNSNSTWIGMAEYSAGPESHGPPLIRIEFLELAVFAKGVYGEPLYPKRPDAPVVTVDSGCPTVLRWTKPNSNGCQIEGYNIYRSGNSLRSAQGDPTGITEPYILYAQIVVDNAAPAPATGSPVSFEDTDSGASQDPTGNTNSPIAYFYKVTAFNAYKESAYSNYVEYDAAPPPAPINLTATRHLASIELNWSLPASIPCARTGLLIFRSTTPGQSVGPAAVQYASIGVNDITFTDSVPNITPGTEYYYKVVPVNIKGRTSSSEVHQHAGGT